MIEKLRGLRLTRAAELAEATVEETLTYYAFPEEHWQIFAKQPPTYKGRSFLSAPRTDPSVPD